MPSDLYVHYKGGKYRKLFVGGLVRNFACDYDVTLIEDAWRVPETREDEPRKVRVFYTHDTHEILIEDPQHTGPLKELAYVYINLTLPDGSPGGRIWVRRKEDFESRVVLTPMNSALYDDDKVPRFREVEKL
jgi:hypothetical protein